MAKRGLYALAFAVVSAVVLAAFHATLLRWMVLGLVQRVPGVETQFDGPLDLTHIVPLTLDATDVNLTFDSDKLMGTRGRLGTVHLEMRFWPLLRGAVHIQRLLVTDADVEIPLVTASGAPEPSPSTLRLPFIEELHLERVHVRIGRAADRPPHELNIANLRLGEGEDGGLTATGSANLDGHELALSANLGSLQELLHPTVPFPIEATLQAPSWDLEAQVAGTLGEPLQGGSARLDMRATTSDMSALREVFFPAAPIAGSVDAKAHLSGDLDAATLSDVSLTIADEDRLNVTLSGSVANLQTMEGMDLRVDALSQDPALTRYLTQETLPSLQSIRLQTTLRGKTGDYRLQDLDAEVTGSNNLSASARGSLRLTDLKSQWPIENAGLDLLLSASVADLAPWLPPGVDRTGTLRFRARLEASAESLGFDDIELDLKDTQPLRGTLNGKLAYTVAQLEVVRTGGESNAEVWIPAQVDVSADLATADLRSLAPMLGQTLPDLGALSAKARLQRDGDAIRITQLQARTIGERPLRLSAEGQLNLEGVAADRGMTEIDLKVTAQGPDAESVASLLGSLPIDPGRWNLKAEIKGKAGALRAEGIEFESGTNESVQARVEGSISNLEDLITRKGKAPTGVEFKGYLTAPSTQQLGTFIGMPLPNLGSFDALFDVRGDKAIWSIPVASVTIAQAEGFDLRATGNASALAGDARFDAQIELRVPDPQRTARGMGGSLPRLPMISADAKIQGESRCSAL